MIEYSVQDMTCGSCVKHITKAVTTLDPQAQVEVDLQTRRVSIESAHSPDALSAAIAAAGYTPVPVAA